MCPYMEESAGIFRYCVSQSSACLAVVTGQQSSVAYCQSDDLSSSSSYSSELPSPFGTHEECTLPVMDSNNLNNDDHDDLHFDDYPSSPDFNTIEESQELESKK